MTGTIQSTTVEDLDMFVANSWLAGAGTERHESVNPATEEVFATFPEAVPADLDAAVAAASEASKHWRSTSLRDRRELLRDLADAIDDRVEYFARLDTSDSGNPLSSMIADVHSAAEQLRYFGGLVTELKGTGFPTSSGFLALSEREPYSVVGRIVPFNHPFKFAVGKAAGALAAGSAVIVKPGEQTSVSALKFGELAREVLPTGLFNVVTGAGSTVGDFLVGHPDVRRIAFTGSVPAGRAVARRAADHIKHVSLELGGKNPLVVFPDVDPVAAAQGSVASMNMARSMGQSCGSTSRVFVHESIAGPFIDALVARVADLRIGDPTHPDTEIGPLAFRDHYEKVTDMIESGVAEGATLAVGGKRPADQPVGFFLEPAVFVDVRPDMRIARDEIFGPVMSVLTWRDYDEMIRLANDTEYGLTANVWTNDIHAAVRTARALEAGYVSINGTGKRPLGTPFGGTKSSGIGKENSLEELLSYTREKSITFTVK